MKRQEVVIVYTTASNIEEAEKIAKTLLEKKIVACVNIIPKIHSLYWWRDKLEEAEEALLLAKTTQTNIDRVIKTIKDIHSYELPAIVIIPIIKGLGEYIDYIRNECIS
jgi:periplasmic divalent cation tolerance protein